MDSEEKRRNYELAEKLLSEQNFTAAIIAGAVATVLAAGIYAVTALATGMHRELTSIISGITHGFVPAAMGTGIGFTMQYLGRGIDSKFALVAAIYAVIGCFLGNLFTAVLSIARANQISPFDVLSSVPASEMSNWVFTGLLFVDLIFWLAAIGGAAYFVKRRLSHEEGLALHMYEVKR